MRLERFWYSSNDGWSVAEFPAIDSDQTVVFVFFSPELAHSENVFAELRHAYPTSQIVGCSTSGEIHNERLTDQSLSVAAIRFEHTQVRTAFASISDAKDSLLCGERLSATLNAPDIRGVLVFSDGLHVNGSALVQGLTSGLPEGTSVTGGLAGDGDRFQKTWSMIDGKPVENGVVAVGLYGDAVHIGRSSRGGWDIFGIERQITRSKDNVLFELDGKPALTLYREYLGEFAKNLPAAGLLFPLSIRSGNGYEDGLVRTILAIDEDEMSLTFAGDVPEGAFAQLMRANPERLIDGAGLASQAALPDQPEGPVLSIAVSCVGRRLVLAERTEEEVEASFLELPEGSAQVGFYSYGEIGASPGGSANVLHNQTFTVTHVWEDAA